MEIWFDGSADGRRAAWAELILETGRKPLLIYGTADDIPCDNIDRWAAHQVVRRLGRAPSGPVLVVSDREDQVSNLESRRPRLIWAWRSHRHPVIRQLDRIANCLRRALPLPTAA